MTTALNAPIVGPKAATGAQWKCCTCGDVQSFKPDIPPSTKCVGTLRKSHKPALRRFIGYTYE